MVENGRCKKLEDTLAGCPTASTGAALRPNGYFSEIARQRGDLVYTAVHLCMCVPPRQSDLAIERFAHMSSCDHVHRQGQVWVPYNELLVPVIDRIFHLHFEAKGIELDAT